MWTTIAGSERDGVLMLLANHELYENGKDMKKCRVAVVLVGILAGCHAAPKDTKIDYLDRVYSKAEYLADANLRSKVLSTCDDREGELLNDPNCVNANLARMDIGNAERAKAAQKEIARLNSIK